MFSEHIYPHDRLVELGIRALYYIVVQVLFIPKGVHPFEDKVKQRLQILRARTRDEYIRIPVRKSC
jgi:flagellar biosynthesis regulator FlbT